MECFLHIHNLHHTEQRGLAGLPCTYILTAHALTRSHTYSCSCVYTCAGQLECIDKKGGGNNKRKGANSLLQSCHVRSIWQINPLLRRRWRFPHIPKQTFVVLGHMMTCQIRFSALLLWRGVYSGVPGQYHCICKLDPCYRLAPCIVHA